MFGELIGLFAKLGWPFAHALIDDSFERQPQIEPDRAFGGVAGGLNFREHPEATRLFKFPIDICVGGQFVYGGAVPNNQLAAKSASHELKSVQTLMDARIEGLHLPLVVVYTYRDRRVTCVSMLPIDGDRTRLHGSANGRLGDARRAPADSDEGATVTAICRALNLAALPFDAELHRGHDNRLYLIDPARLSPPEVRDGLCRHAHLLRPELVRMCPRSLVPDAALPHVTRDAREGVRVATTMLDAQIGVLICELNSRTVQVSSSWAGVKALLHGRGMNMRHWRSTVMGALTGEARAQAEAVTWERVKEEQKEFDNGTVKMLIAIETVCEFWRHLAVRCHTKRDV